MDFKLIYVFVNYNNSNESILTIESILNTEFENFDYIIIIDNASNTKSIEVLENFIIQKNTNIIFLKNSNNVGYFGGLNIGINYITQNNLKFDALIIGNNDLLFPKDFKSMIFKKSNLFLNYPVISPNIITLDGEHQNPHVISSISKFREVIYDVIYLNYYLFKILGLLAKLTHSFTDRNDEKQDHIAQEIYQGYGACYILTPLFFLHFKNLDNPSFLFYEEFFLSKQLERVGYKYFYEPEIKLIHRLHTSTGLEPKLKLWKFGRDSHKKYRILNPIFKKFNKQNKI
jgi:GT2 family glycosyltransferase